MGTPAEQTDVLRLALEADGLAQDALLAAKQAARRTASLVREARYQLALTVSCPRHPGVERGMDCRSGEGQSLHRYVRTCGVRYEKARSAALKEQHQRLADLTEGKP